MKARTHFGAITAGVFLAFTSACETGWCDSGAQLRSSGRAPRGWKTRQDPAGFSVQVPAEWKVRADGQSGRAEMQGPEDEQVIVWPVFLPESRQDRESTTESLSVPAQWNVSGGMFRFASVDTRPALEAISPDAQIRITSGDAQIPTFTLPNQMLAFAGYREGSWYSPGYGVQMMVMRYTRPEQFARDYVTRNVTQGCSDLRFVEVRARPDLVQTLNAIYAQSGMPVTMSAGEVAFSCQKNGNLMRGYYSAAIQLVQQPGNGLWHVEQLFGYLAPGAKADWAESVMNSMLKSVELNPQWVSMQQHLAMNVSKIVAQTQEVISKMSSDSYWNRQGVMDELSRRRSNTTLGVVDVIDPVTGIERKVENSSNYYWIDQRQNIVGTETYTVPSVDHRELIQLP